MKVLTKILIVLAVLVVLLGIAAGVLYFLATTDDNAGKYEAEPSTDIVEPAVKAGSYRTGNGDHPRSDQRLFLLLYSGKRPDPGGASGQKAVFAARRNTGSRQPVPGVRGTGEGFGNYRPGTDDLLRGRQGVFSANQRYEDRQAEGAGLLGPVLDFVQAAGGNGGSGRHGCHRLAAFADSVR